jgi:hypothetical protein
VLGAASRIPPTLPCAGTVVEGVVKPCGKTDRSLRAVPRPTRAAEALDEHPTRLDTRVLFPGARGGPLALSPFRHRKWLDRTYGYMLPDALDRARSALDTFVRGLSGDSTEAAEE